MHDFRYVSRKEAQPIKDEMYQIVYEVQNLVRDNFTFNFTLIGSSSRNMITYDAKSNIGFDFDINIEVNDDDENFEPKEIRTIIRNAIDRVAPRYGYKYCEDSREYLPSRRSTSLPLASFTAAILQLCIIVPTAGNNTSVSIKITTITLGNIKVKVLVTWIIKSTG